MQRAGIEIWRSANDIVMAAGVNGVVDLKFFMQLVGAKPNPRTKRPRERIGQAWRNPLCCDLESGARCLGAWIHV